MAIRRWALLLAGSACAFASSTSYAQTVSDAQAGENVDADAIVVTARRVAENQQDVPMSLTAITGEQLRENGVTMVSDLPALAPSLTVATELSRNQTNFIIRGQRGGSSSVGTGGGPAVVPYFAEAPVYASGPGLFFDLQNVQVLNGPQGTLFGQNTTGGAILFEPARPTQNFEGYLMGTIGSYNRIGVEGVVNIPIVDDKVLFRAGFQIENREGYSHDVVRRIDYDDRQSNVFRASLILRPTDTIENYTVGYLVTSNENGPGVVLLAANPAHPFFPLFGPALAAQQARDIRNVSLDAVQKDRVRTSSIINRTTVDLADSLTLTNIFSWSRYQRDSGRDDDGTPFPIQNSNGAYRPGSWNTDIVQFTEELRFTGKLADDLLTYQVGGYYDRSKPGGPMTYTQNLQTVVTTNQLNAYVNGESKALFGQVGVDTGKAVPALEGLNLTAGFRYTWNKFDVGLELLFFPGISFPPPDPVPGSFCQLPFGAVYPNCLLQAAGKSEGESFAFGADYAVTKDVLLFANYKRGYKPGGINAVIIGLGGTTDSLGYAYRPETVDTIEGGIKTEWRAGNLRGHFNLAAYVNKYDDIQAAVPLLLGNLTTGGVGNAAQATIKGIEAEADIRVSDLFSISGGYSYTDAKYDTYISGTQDLSDLPFVYTPKNQFNVRGNFTLPLPDAIGAVTLQANYTWRSRTYVGDTDPTQPFSFVPSYGLLGARIDWKNVLNSKNVDLAVFATNLTNKVYQANVIQQYNASGYTTAFFGEPRMYGASLRVSF